MYEDYVEAVLQNYQELKAANKLSSNLKFPAPAKLKRECMLTYLRRFDRKDEKALVDFFGPKPEKNSWNEILEQVKIERFKPLANYLKGETNRTNEANVEILAWLIGFEERPFDIVKGYAPKKKKVEFENIPVAEPEQEQETELVNQIEFESGVAEEVAAAKEEEVELEVVVEDEVADTDASYSSENASSREVIINKKEDVAEEKIIVDKETAFIFKETKVGLPETDQTVPKISFFKKWNEVLSLRKLIVPAILVFIAIVAVYLFKNKNVSTGACMYWAGDHYESIACQPLHDTLVIPLDSQRLSGFKKIMKQDTITYSSIGRVWYSKIKNNLEFYTGPGEHPVERSVRLKPITAYMIDKHIAPVQQMGGAAR